MDLATSFLSNEAYWKPQDKTLIRASLAAQTSKFLSPHRIDDIIAYRWFSTSTAVAQGQQNFSLQNVTIYAFFSGKIERLGKSYWCKRFDKFHIDSGSSSRSTDTVVTWLGAGRPAARKYFTFWHWGESGLSLVLTSCTCTTRQVDGVK